MRTVVPFIVVAVCCLVDAGCGKQSDRAGAGQGNKAPMQAANVMSRPVPPRRVAWAPDPKQVCPTNLPAVQVTLDRLAKGVRVNVQGTSALAARILRSARYLERAAKRAPKPESALSPAARQRCPVVLANTTVAVKANALGAEILLTSKAPLTAAKLWTLAQRRLARAYPSSPVAKWKCGDFKGAPSQRLQRHQRHAIFVASPQERLVPTGWDSGDTTISNEARLELFYKAAKDRGGGYVGVGSTQNFVLASWANAEWIWLMDFTRIVVDANKAHIAFLRESPNPKAFQALWQPAKKADGLRILRRRYAADPGLKKIEHAYVTAAKFVSKRFGQLNGWAKQYRFETWLTSDKLYGRLRRLALQGRIRALRGDLNGPATLCGIGEAAKRMGVVIRILYPSNAEEYKVFRPYKWTFRRNVQNLPTDERSLVLRTYTFSPSRLIWPKGWKGVSKVGFHYNAQPLRGFQALLKLRKLDIKQVMTKAADPDRDGFSLSKP